MLCNQALASYVSFDEVAYVKGSVLAPLTGPGGPNGTSISETEAVAVVQVLKAVDKIVTMDGAKNVVTGCNYPRDNDDDVLVTPGGVEVS
jgi:hypothetical protein